MREVSREEVMGNKNRLDILVKQKGALKNPFHVLGIELLVEGAAIHGLRARNSLVKTERHS